MQLVEALDQPGCPLCRERLRSERWEIEMFVRDGRFSREARPLFLAGGGYCNRHAWLLHAQLSRHENGAPIADLYGMVLRHDRASLRALRARLGSRTRRQRQEMRRQACLACTNVEAADARHAYFFMQALQDDAVRRRYEHVDGLCVAHALSVLEEALESEQKDIAYFVIDETLRRMEGVAERLAEYDRRRDFRYADQPKGDEQHSWTDVVRLYVGDQVFSR
jgi:hypothetical protein